jgi:hypothetical protein
MQLWKISSRGSGVKSMTVTGHYRRAGKFEQIIAKSSGLKAAALENPGALWRLIPRCSTFTYREKRDESSHRERHD